LPAAAGKLGRNVVSMKIAGKLAGAGSKTTKGKILFWDAFALKCSNSRMASNELCHL
jgi:hypothetical protein